jgi:hypothetical protein
MLDPPLSVLPAAELTPTQPIPDSVPADVKCLFQKYFSILRAGDVLPTPSHGEENHVHTGTHPPVFAKARRLDPEKLESAKAEFKHLDSAGIVRCSKPPWASPLHMVPNKGGSWRPCGDYRHLNLIATSDKYPLPNMQDLSNGLHDCKNFQRSILSRVTTKFPSQKRTSQKQQLSHNGLSEYLSTLFGLSNTTKTF